MTDPELADQFLGELETEIVALSLDQAGVEPNERVQLDRVKDPRKPSAIRVENGRFEPVGWLPDDLAGWLAPLVDAQEIRLDGYVPADCGPIPPTARRCPLVLMLFGSPGLLEPRSATEPPGPLERIHETVHRAYRAAQALHDPDAVLELVGRLHALEHGRLLGETRLLIALVPGMARELLAARSLQNIATYREALESIRLGEPLDHGNLTVFPLLWPSVARPAFQSCQLDHARHCLSTVEAAADRLRGGRSDPIPPSATRQDEPDHAIRQDRQRLHPPQDASGVLVAQGSRVLGVDLFDSPATLTAFWDWLRDHYLLHRIADAGPAPPADRASSLRFLARAASAAQSLPRSVNLDGRLEIVAPGMAGVALVHSGRLCHALIIGTSAP